MAGHREGFLVVEIDRFEGPLDLLLHLIRQQDIDIFDIPIARITDQFLAAVQGIRPDELDSAGEFLEMAAALVRIKAQMLLPRHDEEEDEDPRAELVRRLLEYEQIQEIATRLSTAEAHRARQFGKGYVEARPRPAPADTPLETPWEEVWEAALDVSLPEPTRIDHRVASRPVALEDRINLILDALKEKARVEFSKLVRPWENRMHGVMTFLAGLELTRRRAIRLRQVRPFAELWIYLREEGDGGADPAGETREADLEESGFSAQEAPGADREERGPSPKEER